MSGPQYDVGGYVHCKSVRRRYDVVCSSARRRADLVQHVGSAASTNLLEGGRCHAIVGLAPPYFSGGVLVAVGSA